MSVRRGELLAVGLAALCAMGIRAIQPVLAASILKVRLKDDTVAIPPAKELRALTFGYRAAGADLLWASLLVEHGVHSQERRSFPSIRRYLDGIIELEPDHPMVYQFVDTLLVLAKPGEKVTLEDVRDARAYLERGTKERPYDHDVWLHYGQYLAFLAPSFLEKKEDIERWRTDGALAISQAVLLGADADRSLAVGTILNQAGEKKAAIEQLQRAYAIADNPDTRMQIRLKLQRLEAMPVAEESVSRVEHEWHVHWPFLSRGATLLIGPARDPALCAGADSETLAACPRDWSAVVEDGR
jgi:hypothetical protein